MQPRHLQTLIQAFKATPSEANLYLTTPSMTDGRRPGEGLLDHRCLLQELLKALHKAWRCTKILSTWQWHCIKASAGRMEDEGTPPAEHEGFLSGEVSPSYHSRLWQPREWQDRAARPQELAAKRGTKVRRPVTDSEAVAVDLITLLEENWYGLFQLHCVFLLARKISLKCASAVLSSITA